MVVLMRILLLLLLLAVSGWSAIGDIVSVSIDTSGWFAFVEIEGLDTNGTYNLGDSITLKPDYAKIQFTVSSEGYNTSLVRAKHSRIVYGTKQLRNVYPYHEDNADTLISGNVVCKVALSSAIFSRDSNITATIYESFYTQGIEHNNSATDLAVTNNSNAEYPKVIGNWSYPGQSVVTDDFTVRGCFAHYSAENGKMIQGVKFTATDQHGHTFTSSVLNPIFSNDSIIEFFDTIDVSGFTVGDQITVNWTAYPIWGDSLYSGDGVNTWPTPLYCPQYYKYVADRYCAVVDVNMADDASGQVILNSTFNPSAPPTAYKNMFAAINAIRVAMGTADVSGAIIYLRNGDHALYGGTITSGTVANYYITIQNFPNESPVITSISTGALPVDSYVKLKGLDVRISTGNFASGETAIWIDSCTDNRTGGYFVYSSVTPTVYFLTNNTVNVAQNIPHGTTNNPIAILRNNHFNASGRLNAYMIIGNKDGGISTYYSGMTIPPIDNLFIGFNFFSVTGAISMFGNAANPAIHGVAIIQNIFEKTTGTNPCLQIAADGSLSSPVNNVLIWHNTIIGERFNYSYNDINLTGIDPPAQRKLWSVKNNIVHRMSIVTDIDPHGGDASPLRNGNWYNRYGVQRSGNVFITRVYENEFWGFNSVNPTGYWISANNLDIQNYIKFVADKSYVGNGAGNGDYHLLEGSPAIGNAYDWVLPYDLDGNERYSGGAAGAYEYGEIPDTTPSTPTITSVSPSSPRLFKTFEATGTNLSNCKLYLNSVSLGTPASATSTTISDTALGTTRGFHWLIAEDTLTGMRCSTSSRIYIKNTQLDTVLLRRP